MGAPSLGKAAKLESRPGNANRFDNRKRRIASPTEQIPSFGHWATKHPGWAEWGKKTRTRQNGSSCDQQSRSSPERGMGKRRARTSHGQTEAQEQADRAVVDLERFLDRVRRLCVSNSRNTRSKKKCAQTKTHQILCGTCRKIHVSKRLTYKHAKHSERALVFRHHDSRATTPRPSAFPSGKARASPFRV